MNVSLAEKVLISSDVEWCILFIMNGLNNKVCMLYYNSTTELTNNVGIQCSEA